MPTNVTILGSTGSIGVSTLDVIRRHSGDYAIHALTANTNVDSMFEQCIDFAPKVAVMRDANAAEKLRARLLKSGCDTTVLSGDAALEDVASADGVDAVMAAIVGGAGLSSTIAAARAGKRVLLANKESLVMAGPVFMNAVVDGGATLLPIDSEHNAIYQCLANGARDHASGIRKILLTGSGGPLLRAPVAEFHKVTPAQACAHPNWRMGRKISIDSATMMNKGLELIEACWLFSVDEGTVEIVIHPQSIVHSMVEYLDGSVVAQLGNPDMRTPIAHGLAWPRRIESGVGSLDLLAMGELQFEAVDIARFPCLALARQVAKQEQPWSIALNAANEVAVQGFLDELIAFTDIPVIIEKVLEQTCAGEVHTIEDVLEVDRESREMSVESMNRVRAGGRR